MNFEYLECFVTIVELGSFRRASETLNKAQSAVSYSIRSLEESLGYELFDRTGYRPQVTERGRALYGQAKVFLSAGAQLEKFAKGLHDTELKILRISIETALDPTEAINVIKKIKEKFPAMRIELKSSLMRGPMSLLQSDKVELAITSFLAGETMNLEFKPFTELSLVTVTSPELIPDYQSIRPEYLDQYTQIVTGEISSNKEENAGFLETSPKWSVSSFEMKKKFILNGLGWGNVPKHLIASELKSKKLVEINGMRRARIHTHVVRKASTKGNPVLDEIFDLF